MHHARKAVFSTNFYLKSIPQLRQQIEIIVLEMKKNWLKYSLTLIWLFCFFAFKQAYWAESDTQVAIHLDLIRNDNHSRVDGRWRSCMSYLSQQGICSTIEVSDQFLQQNATLETWLQELKRHGHQIMHNQKATNRWQSTTGKPTSPLQINLVSSKGELSPSQPTINFRRQLADLLKSSDFFIIKDNPSNWNDTQLAYFKENIGYLFQQGINFVHLESDNPAKRGMQQ